MFGLQSEHQDRSEYERSIERGETVLAVTVADEDADAVMSILERQSPLDVDAQATERGSAEAEAAPGQRREQVPARAEALPVGSAPGSRNRKRPLAGVSSSANPRRRRKARRSSRLPRRSFQVGKRTVNRGTTQDPPLRGREARSKKPFRCATSGRLWNGGGP